MKELDYGKGYHYAHDAETRSPTWTACPTPARPRVLHPTHEGREKRFAKRLEEIKRLKQPASSRQHVK